MSRRARSFASLLVGVLIIGHPAWAFAQGSERYLPAGSQIVVQVDAHQKTKAAYDRTAMGQMMQGDTGKFLVALGEWIISSSEKATDHFDVINKDDFALIRDSLAILERLNQEGLALGIEVKQAWPPEGRMVLVLPKL